MGDWLTVNLMESAELVDTGSSTIFRFDNVLSKEACDEISNYILFFKKSSGIIHPQIFPWHDGDTFHWFDLANADIRNLISNYRITAERLVSRVFNQPLYVETTDLVLWRPGRHMPRHYDDSNGLPSKKQFLPRVVSSILYINDDFSGGETFISTEHGYDYISTPKTGSMVCFLSSVKNMHGVKTITAGNRITLPIWFCSDVKFSENVRLSINEQ